MKNLIFLVVLAALIVSCKKETEFAPTAGSSEKMIVTNQNKTVKATAIDAYLTTEQIGIDLDDDGSNDLLFESLMDSIDDSEDTFITTEIGIKILNPVLSIYENPTSGNRYELLGPPSYDNIGTYTRETRELRTSCERKDGSTETSALNAPFTFDQDFAISFQTYEWENKSTHLVINNSGFTQVQKNFNATNDTIFTLNVIREPSCNNIELGRLFYIAFRKTFVESEYYYGWIEALITEENRITILRTAISEETFN